MQLDEEARVALCPWRQNDIIDRLVILPPSEFESTSVAKEVGKVKELGD